MFLTPIVILQNWKWVIPITLMYGSAPCYLSMWMLWRLATAALPEKCYTYGDCVIYSMYQRMLMFFVVHHAGTKVYLYGDVEAVCRRRENVIYLSNHQSTIDWFIANLLAIQQGSLGHIRYILKDGLKYLPLFGFYFRQHGGVYISRGHRFDVKKATRDLQYFTKAKFPVWMVVFPEGTRYNPENVAGIEESQAVARDKGWEVLEQVLTPRIKATHLSIDTLRGHVSAVYDVTIAYGHTFNDVIKKRLCAPSILDLFGGRNQEIHIHVRRIELDYIASGEEEVRKWLNHRFILKDKLLQQFYTPTDTKPSQFPDTCHRLPLSIWQTLPSAIVLSGIFVAMMSCPRGRSLYCKMTLTSTLAGYLWALIRY